jgi:hypothetical protein
MGLWLFAWGVFVVLALFFIYLVLSRIDRKLESLLREYTRRERGSGSISN